MFNKIIPSVCLNSNVTLLMASGCGRCTDSTRSRPTLSLGLYLQSTILHFRISFIILSRAFSLKFMVLAPQKTGKGIFMHLHGYKLVCEISIESRLNFLRAFRSTFAPDLNQPYFRAIFTLIKKNKITNKQRIIAKLS